MPEVIDVKYLVLAEHVEAVNGKHYIMGGGLHRVAVGQLPGSIPRFAVALAITVPYAASSSPHTLGIDVVDVDENSLLGTAFATKFETGRPPGMRAGHCHNVLLAFNIQNLQFHGTGTYFVKVEVDGTELRREELTVTPTAQITGPQDQPKAS